VRTVDSAVQCNRAAHCKYALKKQFKKKVDWGVLFFGFWRAGADVHAGSSLFFFLPPLSISYALYTQTRTPYILSFEFRISNIPFAQPTPAPVFGLPALAPTPTPTMANATKY
jgi:hypothetical protein